MGRRRRGRRRRVYRPRKKIPNIFMCPQCGRKSVGVAISKKEGVVVVKCGACSLESRFEYNENLKAVDYYSKFVDEFYEKGVTSITVPTPTESIPAHVSSSTAESSE